MADNRLELTDTFGDKIQFAMEGNNLAIKAFEKCTNSITRTILEDDSVRQLMDWLNRNFDAQE